MTQLEIWQTMNKTFYENGLISKEDYQWYNEFLEREEKRKEKNNG